MGDFAKRTLIAVSLVGTTASLGGCLSQGVRTGLQIDGDDAGSPPIFSELPGGPEGGLDLISTDPHALIGVDPSHGPFNGGQTRLLRGNGFSSTLRVWFGPNEVPKADVLPIDPTRVQVVVPPGNAGTVDVKVQNADDPSTARVLKSGYVYEDFYADPSSGPTSGGTLLHLYGQGTHWDSQTLVTIGDRACGAITAVSATELTCTTAPGAAGTQRVVVTGSDKVSTVRDGFVYSDSDNGFRGGFAGGKLSSHLTVLAIDTLSGTPIAGAYVLAGDDVTTGLSSKSDATGRVSFDAPQLGPKKTVTVAARCYQPITFIDVPVDTVTAYLMPVFSPACASEGDPPAYGGSGVAASTLRGELVWGDDGEFRSGMWGNVPPAKTGEKRTAYVFSLAGDPTAAFSLPEPGYAVSSNAGGTVGLPFKYDTGQGNITLYALAGIENRSVSPPTFTAYAMGVVRGVSASPGVTTSNIFIPVSIPLDHAITLTARTPQPGPRGPDRAQFSVALELEKGGYAILPAGIQSALMPVDRSLSLVGFPALSGPLSGSRYIASAIAGTGPSVSAPLSQVGRFASKTETIVLNDFVPVPVLSYPAYGGSWDKMRLGVSFAASTRTVDLTIVKIDSGGGLVTWQVIAPGGTRDFKLPDLGAAFPVGALMPGPVSINVYGGHIDMFDYSALRYRQSSPSTFDAYSVDSFPARIE